jgi:hypothetical protein
MIFWIREVVGWLLIVLGLLVFFTCYRILTEGHSILEGSALALVGIIVFRGGIHLLKIAVAARICLETQARLEESRSVAPSGRMPGRGVAPLARRSN